MTQTIKGSAACSSQTWSDPRAGGQKRGKRSGMATEISLGFVEWKQITTHINPKVFARHSKNTLFDAVFQLQDASASANIYAWRCMVNTNLCKHPNRVATSKWLTFQQKRSRHFHWLGGRALNAKEKHSALHFESSLSLYFFLSALCFRPRLLPLPTLLEAQEHRHQESTAQQEQSQANFCQALSISPKLW